MIHALACCIDLGKKHSAVNKSEILNILQHLSGGELKETKIKPVDIASIQVDVLFSIFQLSVSATILNPYNSKH